MNKSPLIALVLALGCGGSTSEAHETTTTSATSAEPTLRTAEVLAIFDRSCARGCHTHDAGDPAATENGAYFDREADVVRLMDSYGVGIADSGLHSLLATIERDGELRIGRARVLMPPEDSGRPPITRDEARRIHLWFAAYRGYGSASE